MSGAIQATFMNQRSFIPPIPAIGSAYEGGFFAGQIGVAGVATHNLVVAPKSSGDTQLQWKNARTATTGAFSNIDGPQNTADIVAHGNSTVYPAAHFCNDLVVGAFTDWYMPAQLELEVCYYNLKPTTTSNNTGYGTNANAVPPRTSNYTSGTPAQTSAPDFQSGGTEALQATYYWSSTQFLISFPQYAYSQYFGTGFQSYAGKNYSRRVRAFRRVAV